MQAMRSGAVVIAVAVLAAFTGGCGGGTSEADKILAAQERGEPLRAEERMVERRLVTDRDVATAPDRSAQKAFLEFWAALAYEDWSTAFRYLDPSLRSTLEPDHVVAAFKLELQNNVPVRPLIRGAVRTRAGVTLRYFVRTGDARLRPTSSTWVTRDGTWYLRYSSTFDDSFATAVQQAVQFDVDATAKSASRRAVAAGARARGAQARTLVAEPSPTPTPTPTTSGGSG